MKKRNFLTASLSTLPAFSFPRFKGVADSQAVKVVYHFYVNIKIFFMILRLFAFITTFTLLLLLESKSFGQTKDIQHKPGETFKDCKDCPEMVVIPAGSFMMGAPANEQGSYPEEKPQRKVSIQKFAAGKFDITKQQWALFVKETNRPVTGGCTFSGLAADTSLKPWDPNPAANWNHLGFMQDSSHPVVCITWDDTQDYLKWLSKKTGFTYRLLTEAEWEYAARSGTTTAYYWGDSASHDYANYGVDTAFGIGYTGGRDKWLSTSPVGSFPPNRFGLYDMSGNVLQYVADYFQNSFSKLPINGSAYLTDTTLNITGDLSYMNGTKSSDYRIVRGGDWGDPRQMLRSACRNWAPGQGGTLKKYSSSGLGFRIARAL